MGLQASAAGMDFRGPDRPPGFVARIRGGRPESRRRSGQTEHGPGMLPMSDQFQTMFPLGLGNLALPVFQTI